MGISTKVWSHSERTYAERPESFLWEGRLFEVETIEKAWQEPGEKHFRARTKGDKLFELCYHELWDEWTAIELIQL